MNLWQKQVLRHKNNKTKTFIKKKYLNKITNFIFN